MEICLFSKNCKKFGDSTGHLFIINHLYPGMHQHLLRNGDLPANNHHK